MTQVNRRPQMPSRVSCVSPVPGEVLFQRGVGSASVAATGSSAASKSSCVPSSSKLRTARVALDESHGGSASGQRLSVRSVLKRLVTVASRTADQADQQSPRSALPLVLHGLRKRAAAAKVSRGWRRLERTAEAVGVSPARIVASRSESSSSRALRSVVSRSLRPAAPQSRNSHASQVSVASRVLQ